jgi:hypothetical protein
MTTAETFFAGLPKGDRPEPSAVSDVSGLKLLPGEFAERLKRLNPACPREQWRDIVAAARATPTPEDDDEKLELVIVWSRAGGDFFTSDEEVEKLWQTMPPKAGGLAAGTFIKLSNAAGYVGPTAGKNDASSEEVFGEVVAALAVDDQPEPAESSRVILPADEAEIEAHTARVNRFRAAELEDYVNLPEPEFWDDDGLTPKFPGGTVGIAYGAKGVGKSTVVQTIVMDAIRQRGAHVCYSAGEGAYALRKKRFPAVAEAQGLTLRDLRGKLQVLAAAPNLTVAEDAEALIEAQTSFRPNIVVVDTLATALPGADENSAQTGSLLSGNGPAGRIRDAFGAAVIFVAHSGKDASKGIRGSSAFAGNVDFVWEITSDKEAGTARLHVRHMKDGPDGFSVFFRVTPAANGVPVARRITKAEYSALTAAGLSNDRRDVAAALRKLGPGPHTTHVLASTLIPLEPNQADDDHARAVRAEVKRLQRLARPGEEGKRGILADYVAHQSANTRDPMLWGLLSASEEDDDD